MNKVFFYLLLTLNLFSFYIDCAAKTLIIGSSEAPPHTINGEFHGIDLDITKLILNKLGYQVEFQFMGLARAKIEVEAGRIDAMAPIFWQQDSAGFYASTPFINYKPTVFSLTKNKLNPGRLSDLSSHSIVTFQGATGYFNNDFIALSKEPGYQELKDMSVIAELLVKNRFEYAILDKYVFYYFYRINNKTRDTSIFTEHNLIPQVPASVGFHNIELRNKFNQVLEGIHNNKDYRAILNRYLGVNSHNVN